MTDRWFSPTGLAHLHDVMAGHVERGAMPGLIALVARNGRAHVDVVGTGTFGDTGPLRRDAVFRIASLTKPIVAAAAMILVDDGILRLDAPIDDLLPEMANRQVLRSAGAELDDTVPANRPITLRDVLTFRLGIGVVMAAPGTCPIQRAEAELGLGSLGPPWPPSLLTPDEWIRRLGTLPLVHQPGEQWMYNTGSQVLGILLERAAGTSLETLLRQRIFEPLGMDDTAFTISPAMRDRMTTAYTFDQQTGELSVLDAREDGYWSRPLAFPNPAGWLLSTIDNYWAFVQMFLNKGAHEGTRILSQRSVELMTTDHLEPAQRAANGFFFGEYSSWGLGMGVPAAGVSTTEIPRGFGWSGGTGTTWTSDVDRDLTGILFTQRAMSSPAPPEIFSDFWRCAYDASDD